MHEEAFYVFFMQPFVLPPPPPSLYSRQHLGLNRNVFLCCFLKAKIKEETWSLGVPYYYFRFEIQIPSQQVLPSYEDRCVWLEITSQ